MWDVQLRYKCAPIDNIVSTEAQVTWTTCGFSVFQCVLLKLSIFSIFLFLLDRPLSVPLPHSPCVCPFIASLHRVLLLHCPSASAPCHVTVPDHDTLRWDILVLYGSNGQKGIYVSFSSEQWKPDMRARWISGATRKQHRNRLLPCRLHVACAVRNLHVVDAASEGWTFVLVECAKLVSALVIGFIPQTRELTTDVEILRTQTAAGVTNSSINLGHGDMTVSWSSYSPQGTCSIFPYTDDSKCSNVGETIEKIWKSMDL